LSFAEREEIAILHAQHKTVREIARELERSPSTILRELRRNAATQGGSGATDPRPGRSAVRPDDIDIAWVGDVTCVPTDEGWLYLAR
jgi:transposase-like protein